MIVHAIDLYAGCGGWDVALEELGISPLGIEIDDAACATREAAGLRTLQGDVAAIDPASLGECDLCLGSPPCPTFSSAGNGAGRSLTDVIARCLHELAVENDTRAERRQEAFEILEPVYWEAELEKAKRKGREPDREKSAARARRDADMSLLVVEPLRYILDLEPRWVALEQVPEVLGIWSEMAAILSVLGYKTWTGCLSAEQFGVPQTRKRAILMADLEGPVHPPVPTHQRYVKGEEQRHEVTLLGEVLPWVSMAEALGWGMTERPSITVVSGGERWGAKGLGGGSGAEETLRRERERGAFALRSGQTVGGHNWPRERPSTAVCGDPRISPPGYRGGKAEYAELEEGEAPERSMDNAIRVSLPEALVLQSFPPDFPVQGTKSQRYLQVGNAIPPLLAQAILTQLLAPVLEPSGPVEVGG